MKDFEETRTILEQLLYERENSNNWQVVAKKQQLENHVHQLTHEVNFLRGYLRFCEMMGRLMPVTAYEDYCGVKSLIRS